MTSAPVSVDIVKGHRIGFLADTHVQAEDASDLPQQVLDALHGVDLIVHCGHYGNPAILDRLGTVAPVLALRTPLDERQSGARLDGEYAGRVGGTTRVLAVAGVHVGVIFDLSGKGFDIKPDDPPIALDGRSMAEALTATFGRPVDVVVHANTHIDRISYCQGVLLVNPGSPNLPAGPRKGGLGTLAILDVRGGFADVEIVDLRRLVS